MTSGPIKTPHSGDDAARERYAKASALFDAAVELPTGARAAYIDGHAGADAALSAQVHALLTAHERMGGFLEVSVAPDARMLRAQTAIGDTYVLIARIASGGMASIYKADDAKHARQVAIKVFAAATDGHDTGIATAQRFLDEIRVTAALQHVNVMPLFDSGAADGLLYFVMPFVDGETLRARLQRTGPLSVQETVEIARGVADGLDHAHRAGIVHRDLKPENILLRDGQPLICDFGIALGTASLGGARQTLAGAVVGTPQYMSPEQAAGAEQLDARTDIYSLGAIVYEALVGDPPHVASTTQGILAKVRSETPTAVHLLRPTVSLAVSDVIAKALAKQPADRYPTARAFRDALAAAAAQPVGESRRASWTPSRGLVVGAAALVALAVIAFAMRPRATESAVATRFVLAPFADAAIGRSPVLTPDGSTIVYAGAAATSRAVFVRRVSELEAHALRGTHGALATFISPNGTQVAFTTSDDRLMRIGIDGSNLTDIVGVFRYSDATWLNDSALVYDSYGEQGLTLAPAFGGATRPLTKLDVRRHDSVHQMPFALGDGRSVVFLALRGRSGPGAQLGELSLARLRSDGTIRGDYTPLGIQSRRAVGFVDGWLLFLRGDGKAVMAVRLDVERGIVSGEPQLVLEQEGGGIQSATLARNGTLLYSRRVQPNNAPVLVDTSGVASPILAGLSGAFMSPRVSRDGRRVVVQRATAEGNDAWLYDLQTGSQSRLTTSGGAIGPAWNGAGTGVVYFSTRDGRDALWFEPADGSAPARRLVESPGAFAASPTTADSVLLFQRRVNGAWSIWRAPAEPTAPAIPVVQGAQDAFMPDVSADGHWLAYAASESGRYEVFLKPFPGSGAAVQVSLGGGTEPAWSPDGRTIFYRADRRMMAADLTAGVPRTVIRRRMLFADTFDGDMPMPHRNYDVMPDGRRFVMIAPNDDRAPETIVVLNWLNELRAKVAQSGR